MSNVDRVIAYCIVAPLVAFVLTWLLHTWMDDPTGRELFFHRQWEIEDSGAEVAGTFAVRHWATPNTVDFSIHIPCLLIPIIVFTPAALAGAMRHQRLAKNSDRPITDING